MWAGANLAGIRHSEPSGSCVGDAMPVLLTRHTPTSHDGMGADVCALLAAAHSAFGGPAGVCSPASAI